MTDFGKAPLRPLVAAAIVVAIWAAIYLPALGAPEIKGEEIRRIMPGLSMLESGDWIVPHFNGQPYLRKPPLVNWAIAAAVKTCGVRREWVVRLPSVVAVLAMALTMLFACSPWLGTNTALAAVLMVLTSAGLVEKGRLAEIEAIYIALAGMATACWLGWIATGRSRWLTWPVTGFLLGLALLAKGPPHLGYFYAVALCIGLAGWRRAPEDRAETGLISWAHLAGLVIMFGVFALWCVPYLRETARLGAAGVWARQMGQRIGGGDSGTVFTNFARSLVNFLPWVLALPLFWHRKTLGRLAPRDRLMVEAARWPIVACAFLLMFVPGMLPRYTLPLLVPFVLFLALLLKTFTDDRALAFALPAAIVAALGMMTVGIFFGARMAAHGHARDFARQVNAVAPAGSPICIFNPGVQPEVFYIRAPIYFDDSVKTLPANVACLVAPNSSVKLLRGRFRESRVLAEVTDAGGRKYSALELSGRH